MSKHDQHHGTWSRTPSAKTPHYGGNGWWSNNAKQAAKASSGGCLLAIALIPVALIRALFTSRGGERRGSRV